MKMIPIGVALLLGVSGGQLQAQSVCLAASDSATMIARDALIDLVTSSDSETAATRTRSNLPLVTPTDVEVVTDSSLCARALTALAPLSSSKIQPLSQAFVLRVGSTRFIAFNFRQYSAGNFWAIVYDTSFNKLASVQF